MTRVHDVLQLHVAACTAHVARVSAAEQFMPKTCPGTAFHQPVATGVW